MPNQNICRSYYDIKAQWLLFENQVEAAAIDTVIEGFFSTKLPLLKGTLGFPSSKKNLILLSGVGILLEHIALLLVTSLVHPTGVLCSAFPHFSKKYDTIFYPQQTKTLTYCNSNTSLPSQQTGTKSRGLSLRAFTSVLIQIVATVSKNLYVN